jgi:hypothetical protein
LKGVELRRETVALGGELHRAQESERRAEKDGHDLADHVGGHEQPLPLERTVAELILTLRHLQLENRVLIAAISPLVPTGHGTTQDLKAISAPVGQSSLRVIALEVKGTYREYAGLNAFLMQLRQQPAAITHLAITGNSFQIQLKVFGTLS